MVKKLFSKAKKVKPPFELTWTEDGWEIKDKDGSVVFKTFQPFIAQLKLDQLNRLAEIE